MVCRSFGSGLEEVGELALRQDDAFAEVLEGQAQQLLDLLVDFFEVTGDHFTGFTVSADAVLARGVVPG